MARVTSGMRGKARVDQDQAAIAKPTGGRNARPATRKATVQRTGVVVLGMHRSGTSALTRMLSLLGCALPRNLLEANPTNPTGHWESLPVCAYNDQILEATGHHWFDWLPVSEDWSRSLVYGSCVQGARAVLRDEYGEASLFVLKDPRMCRLAGLWMDALDGEGVTPAVVIALRNPFDVADSLARRDSSDASVGLLVWLRHVLDAERYTRGRKRIFVTYDDLMANWGGVARRIGEGLGLIWPRSGALAAEDIDAFLNPSLRHHAHAPREVLENPMLSSWIRRVYDVLLGWAAGVETTVGTRELDAVRAALDEAGPAFARPLRALARETARAREMEQDKQALLEQVAALDVTLGERSTALEAALGDVVAMDARRDAAERRLIELDMALEAADGDRGALSSEIGSLRASLGEMDQAAQDARAQAAYWENEVREATASLHAIQHRLAELESTLAQRQEELVQVWRELEAERQRGTEVAGGLRDALAMSQAEVASLREALAEAEAERLALETAHAIELTQSRCSMAQVMAELQEYQQQAVRAREEATAEAIAMTRILQESEAETQRAKHDLVEARRHLAATADAVTVTQNEVARLLRQLEQETVERQGLAQQLEAAEQGGLQALAGRVQAEQQVNERFSEIAAITVLLREQTVKAKQSGDRVEWLVSVQGVLQRCPRWWAFMPKRWRKAKQSEWLAQHGLFDARSYVARYPDVAAEGMDPLHHYMRFGMAEGRLL